MGSYCLEYADDWRHRWHQLQGIARYAEYGIAHEMLQHSVRQCACHGCFQERFQSTAEEPDLGKTRANQAALRRLVDSAHHSIVLQLELQAAGSSGLMNSQTKLLITQRLGQYASLRVLLFVFSCFKQSADRDIEHRHKEDGQYHCR